MSSPLNKFNIPFSNNEVNWDSSDSEELDKQNDSSDDSEDSDETPETQKLQDASKPIQFDTKVIIFAEQKGKHINTYIVGLEGISKDNPTILKYLKMLKTSHGCNGTIKQVLHESENKPAIQLQGDLIKEARTFLKQMKIVQKIKIKPLK